MDTHNNIYKINIYERYLDLKNSNKPELDNQDLWKIFEYYSCLKLSEEYQKPFYEYDDICPSFKELNKMSRNDTGIDLSDLDNIIVQCKLRKTTLTWKECATFFGSQVIFNKELNKSVIRWDKLIITRNKDSILSDNLLERRDLFIDRPYDKTELIKFCDDLLANPPTYPIFNTSFQLRDYQLEAINMINQHHNVIINLPTGTGKNSVIIYSFKEKKKYLILVPRIILMEQLRDEIIKHKPKLKTKIQLIGDANNEFNDNKLITICVFNSVGIIEQYADKFDKIYIDEAHHINKPEIYWTDDCDDVSDGNNSEGDNSEDGSNSNTEDDYTNEEEDDYYSEIETEEDKEDELKNIKSYTQIIKSLTKYNNNIYLSATIDKTEEFEYYSKDIRNMIELGYLCDYTIHIPIFSEDPDNKKTCEHLLKNYRNMIIYCNSQKEGHIINALMNKLQNNSSEYIDCMTPKKKRNDIIDRYKKGLIPFLVNVRILVEGFDSPITKGVVFFHLPNSHNTLVQIIGRCLRLHPNKTIANIILPFSCKEDEKQINNFMKVMAKNDSRIKKSYENKQLGGYINIDLVEETEDNDINDMIEFKYNLVYDSMGRLLNGEDVWDNNLEKVINHIKINNKTPNQHNKDKEIDRLARWINMQNINFKKKSRNMKNEIYRLKWSGFKEKYNIYFISKKEKWHIKYNTLIEYINKHNKFPTISNVNKEIQELSIWTTNQKSNFKYKTCIMKLDNDVYNIWHNFMQKYDCLFLSLEEKWTLQLQRLVNYVETHKERPRTNTKNKESNVIGSWYHDNSLRYRQNTGIMKNEKNRTLWKEFLEKYYDKYFLSDEEKWFENFEKIKSYIDINGYKPSARDISPDIRELSHWITTQQVKYTQKKFIMKTKQIYKKWEEFINDPIYKKYFISDNEKWLDNLKKVKEYLDTFNIIPSKHSKDEYIQQIGRWLSKQTSNYKNNKNIMKTNPEIYAQWTEFINDPQYKKYFE
jgi:superfamily II DNA or RNA helicase